MTPFRGAKFDGVRYAMHLGANLEVCLHGWVAFKCESEPPGSSLRGTESYETYIAGQRNLDV